MEELVVNWHITEACNFKCTYCFAKWEDKPCKKELLHSEDNVRDLLDQIMELPSILNNYFDSIRLNLVGGETFLYREAVLSIIQEAKKRGMRLSAITNGSKLDMELNQIIADNFDIIGFSIDSLNEITNLQIGRQQKSTAVDINKLLQDIVQIRQINPNIHLKVNTVVSKFNYLENMGDLIALVKPNKWKVFQMLPLLEGSLPFAISAEQFQLFLSNHQKFNEIISAENNNEMTESYLMIDPCGRFFQNQNNGKSYMYSSEILKVGVETAFKEIEFDIKKFLHRYN
ncbi:viperin family antiviral radical SAM protein [Actinobacillus equuli subsp. equuli]|uniref:S-adenosylmethionine-dependent nucleotide dehydratase n=1 Tax=Actinobacillus equuli subsp. equuli TaxID=202947 RepID=A0A9X4G3C8_ACTEU|nr:viperin family antiviral radical SAM protein [Actinobacillus equuli]MDE8034538.1 viperin family antiviral radical SAM protein [Actinobacillus equuli subsp. equuli]MDG4947586.1 viperin family antiviral radical SAM protein [Actinobacillus equuli subsp. haemolyticus]